MVRNARTTSEPIQEIGLARAELANVKMSSRQIGRFLKITLVVVAIVFGYWFVSMSVILLLTADSIDANAGNAMAKSALREKTRSSQAVYADDWKRHIHVQAYGFLPAEEQDAVVARVRASKNEINYTGSVTVTFFAWFEDRREGNVTQRIKGPVLRTVEVS